MEQHRQTVYERDQRRCVAQRALGIACAGGLTLQHRVNRGMGGSAAVGDGPQWYVTMCAVHNALLESQALLAATAQDNGWALRHTRTVALDVLTAPVRYPDGWYLLNPEGGRERDWARG